MSKVPAVPPLSQAEVSPGPQRQTMKLWEGHRCLPSAPGPPTQVATVFEQYRNHFLCMAGPWGPRCGEKQQSRLGLHLRGFAGAPWTGSAATSGQADTETTPGPGYGGSSAVTEREDNHITGGGSG